MLFWIKKQRAALTDLTEAEIQMIRDHTFVRRDATPAEREARKAFREVIPGNAMTDYAKTQKSLHENRERLKAERLAREAKARARSSSD
jgi:plasmid stabilization system protein ParE